MIQISSHSVIHSLKNLLLPSDENHVHYGVDRASNKWRSIGFTLDVSVSERNTENKARALVSILIVGAQMAFYRVSSFGDMPVKPAPYKNVSNHDSCWIDALDAELAKTYFAMCDTVNPDAAPITLDTNTWFHGTAPKFYEVTLADDVERNEVYGSKYWHKINSQTQITKQQFMDWNK